MSLTVPGQSPFGQGDEPDGFGGGSSSGGKRGDGSLRLKKNNSIRYVNNTHATAATSEDDVMGQIAVQLVDKSKFKFQFTSTTTPLDLLDMVAAKFGLQQPKLFGLKRLRNVRTSIDEDTANKVWLSEHVPLFTQGCDSSTVLFLRHKYWFFEASEITDPASLQAIFHEIDSRLMKDESLENTDDVNIQLAACRVHIAKGDYNVNQSDIRYINNESIQYILPAHIRDQHTLEEWDRLISVFHQRHLGKSKSEVQVEYLQLVKDHTPLVAVTFFPARFSAGSSMTRSTEDILLGVSPDGIGMYKYNPETKKKTLQVFQRFHDILSWEVLREWDGKEAPDYDKPHGKTELQIELTDYLVGPFRSSLFIKTKTKRTKDVEIILSSFVPEDDQYHNYNTVGNFITTYNERFKSFAQILELDALRDHYLTVSTLTGVTKKIRVQTDDTAEDVVKNFAEKIGLTESMFFQLSHYADGADLWLQLKDPILLQGLTDHSTIHLKVRFFVRDLSLITDPVAMQLYYVQIRDKVISGDIPVSEDDAIKLAAKQLQILRGNYDKKVRFAAQIKYFIPFYLIGFHSEQWWEKKIFSAQSKIQNQTKDAITADYLKHVALLPHYGLTYFDGKDIKTGKSCIIGVGKVGLALFKPINLEIIGSYRFGFELRSWSNEGEAIELTVKRDKFSQSMTVAIVSLQFADVIEMLNYYDAMRQLMKRYDKKQAETA